MKDYYSILEISHTSRFGEIHKAYRKRALETHPDVNKSSNAGEEFLLVNEAYETLKNIGSRRKYDALYRVKVLKEKPLNQSRFERKESSRKHTYSARAAKGQTRAESDSKKSSKKYENKKSSSIWWGILDVFAAIGEFFSIFG